MYKLFLHFLVSLPWVSTFLTSDKAENLTLTSHKIQPGVGHLESERRFLANKFAKNRRDSPLFLKGVRVRERGKALFTEKRSFPRSRIVPILLFRRLLYLRARREDADVERPVFPAAEGGFVIQFTFRQFDRGVQAGGEFFQLILLPYRMPMIIWIWY